MFGNFFHENSLVPVQTLLDYLKAGESIDDFLDGFPTVTREQVIALLEEAGKQLVGMVLTEEVLDSIKNGDVKDKSPKEFLQKIIEKWHYLRDNHQDLDPNNPLSDDEIEIIRQFLIQHNQPRPLGVAKDEFIIPDTFDSPLPDEILDLFYSP